MDCDAFRDDLMEVLYDEADDATRRRFAAHAAGCAACREELTALRALRRDLGAWPVPDALLPAGRPRRRPLDWPGVARAAALIVALGAALGLSQAEVRYDDHGLAVRFGGAPGLESGLAAHEAEHRMEMEALAARVTAATAPDPILSRVEALIEASERRQADRLATQAQDLRRETETGRRYDLARVSAGLAYIDGKTGLQSARTNQLVGQILRASQEK